jgi:two-component system heavy metal sensor histidine kinase CusS
MTSFRTIRFRLTAWYFASIILILAFLAHGSWEAAIASIYKAIDDGLVNRMDGVIEVLNQHSDLDDEQLAKRLAESSNLMIGGSLFRVFDGNQRLVYQSTGLSRHQVSTGPPEINGSNILFRYADRGDWRLRLAAKRVDFRGRTWIVEIAEPLRSYENALRRLHGMLLLSLPVFVVLATLVGFSISSRALAPVDRITASAREISANNLSDRLSVPDTHDELQRLSETLNGMLDRIESSFNRNRQFTADASHELRAPLTLIQSAAEFALRRERGRDELLDALRQILHESKRTTQLLNKLLTLARSDANVMLFEPSVVNLTDILGDLRPKVESLASTAQQEVSFYLPPEALEIMGDDASLRQLCLILIDNAMKYTPRHGSIAISLAQAESAAVLTVRDTGIGISKEQLPYVFDRFWRADKIRSREVGGAGLGLSIARVIAEQHGAKISAESELGNGSSFAVKIPLYSARLQVSA